MFVTRPKFRYETSIIQTVQRSACGVKHPLPESCTAVRKAVRSSYFIKNFVVFVVPTSHVELVPGHLLALCPSYSALPALTSNLSDIAAKSLL